MNAPSLLDHACGLALLGWRVFPCAPQSKEPASELVHHGQDDATSDLARINAWFARRPHLNVAVACGPSLLVVVDADPPRAKNGHTDGRARLRELAAELGPLPTTPTQDTGGGGEQYFFRASVGVEFVGKVGKAIDIKRNGYVVVAPSIHPEGPAYRWRDGLAPGDVEIAELPAQWIEFLRRPEHVERTAQATNATGESIFDALASIDQRYVVECLSGSPIVQGERFQFRRSTRGKWNLYVDRGEGWESTSNFVDASGKIGAHASGSKDDGGPLASTWLRWYGHDDKAIRKALVEHVPELARWEREHRDELGARRTRKQSSATSAPSVSSVANNHPGRSDDAGEGYGYRLTEVGNALRFRDLHVERLRYVAAWKTWLAWDGTRWRRDNTGAETRGARDVLSAIYMDASKVLARASSAAAAAANAGLGNVTIDTTKLHEIAEALNDHAARTSKAAAIAAMIKLAQSEDGIAATPDMFDRDDFALNVSNGTIDLRTGELRPHRQSDMITMLAPVAYDPSATATRWSTFLEQVQPDPEQRAWLQRLLGYALTGDVREQVFPFWQGKGGNGKNVTADLVVGIMGDYATVGAPDLLLEKHGEAHPTELADLEGRRIVVCSEIEQGRQWAEARIKMLTGEKTFRARGMKQDFREIRCTAKLVVLANHRPKVRGTDNGLWRRMRLVPWPVVIPNNERDEMLGAKLTAEAPGILRWLVEGCLAWQRDKLGAAKSIALATSGYRDEEDVIGLWIADQCDVDPNAWTLSATLYANYRTWCEGEGIDPWSRKVWRARLLERDGLREATHGRVGRGIGGIAVRGHHG
jgi:putative DNA primase/helicase